MLDDIVSKFAESKNITNFDFALRPNHHIDNPFAKVSHNIIGNLEKLIKKADKSILSEVLLDEAEENMNFAYKIYSQIVEMTAEEEGLLFKARLIEILNKLENKSDDERTQFNELLDFADILTNMLECKINENKLKNAFIINMLIFETCEEMRIRNIHLSFALEFGEHIFDKHMTLLLITATRMYKHNNHGLNNFFISEILQYINRFSHSKNIEMCFDMLYFASLLTDKDSSETIKQVALELQNKSLYAMPKTLVDYVRTGLIFSNESGEDMLHYVCHNIKDFHCINNIAYTFMLLDKMEYAEKFLLHAIKNKKLSKYSKISLYRQLQNVYSILQNTKKVATIAKERFILGDVGAYLDAVDAFTSLGVYEKEKEGLYKIACKNMSLYSYCDLLVDNKEYELLSDRFSMIKSTKDINEAVKFMDDKGIALYDNNTNKKLLNILEQKTKNNKKLAIHVKNLLDLISTP